MDAPTDALSTVQSMASADRLSVCAPEGMCLQSYHKSNILPLAQSYTTFVRPRTGKFLLT